MERHLRGLQAMAGGGYMDNPAIPFGGADDEHGFSVNERDMVSAKLGREVIVAIANSGDGGWALELELHVVHREGAEVSLLVQGLDEEIT
jgi:hypothetical protein